MQSRPSAPQNVATFGDTSLNTPLLKMGSDWSGPLIQYDWCPQKRQTQGEKHDVTTEAENRVMRLDTKGLQGPTGTTRRGGKGGACPEPQSVALCTP